MERAAWTDERLDDLAEAMRSGFDRVDQDMRDLRMEVRALRSDLTGEIASVRSGLGGEIGALRVELVGQIESLHLLLLRVGGALLVTLVGAIAAILLRGA